jgi:hypothetical protein
MFIKHASRVGKKMWVIDRSRSSKRTKFTCEICGGKGYATVESYKEVSIVSR